MVSLRQVVADDKMLLFNLLQKMLCEMTNYYDNDIDGEGNYEYPFFDCYFSEPDRKAFLVLYDERIAGFLMVNPYSYIGQNPDYVLAECFILPKFRKKHIARDAVGLLFRMFPGHWEVKYNTRNVPAARLWNQIAQPYCPHLSPVAEHEEVLSFKIHA